MSDNTERKDINLFDIAEIAANAESAAQSELDALENEASSVDVPIEKGEAAEEIQVEQQKEIIVINKDQISFLLLFRHTE